MDRERGRVCAGGRRPDMQIGGIIAQRPDGSTTVVPHKEIIPSQGEWHYWFVGLRPAAYAGDLITVKYSQDFFDKEHTAKPCLFYPVRRPMGRLELNVEFSTAPLPKNVTCSYIKLSDERRSYAGQGMQYDPEKKWATWVIEKPKKGYCYRIQWEY